MRRARLSSVAIVILLASAACSSTANPSGAPGPTCVGIPAIAASPGSGSAGGAIPGAGSGAPASPADISSPNGVIVFAVGDLSKASARLQSVWPDGSHLADLTAQPVAGFAVSADGKTLELDGADGPALVGLDGTRERPLDVGGLHSDQFRWAPNGQWLVFHGWSTSDPGAEGIYEVQPDCQPVRIAAKGSEHDLPIAVSPDGASILAYGDVAQTSQKLQVGSLYIEHLGDGTRTKLEPNGNVTLVQPGTGAAAAWSRDGKQIAFTAAPTTAAQWAASQNGLYVADAAGGNVKALISNGVVSGVAWSPDGQWIATTRSDASGTPQVWIMKSDGSSAEYLTKFQSPGGCCPIWSPDGASLLTWGGTVIPVSGSSAAKVTPAEGAAPYAYAWVKP